MGRHATGRSCLYSGFLFSESGLPGPMAISKHIHEDVQDILYFLRVHSIRISEYSSPHAIKQSLLS